MVGKAMDKRLSVFQITVLVMLVVLVFRLVMLQVVSGESYAVLADGNRIRIVPIVAPRGTMYDRNHSPLVSSRPAYTVSIILMDLENTEQVVGELSSILQVDEQDMMVEIDKRRRQRRLYEPIRLKVDIDQATHTRLEERRSDLPGVVIEVEPVRYYALGAVAAHVLGYVGASDTSNRVEGKTGLERYYDSYLQGTDGGKQVEVNARGTYAKIIGQVEPVPGNNLVLTIDEKLQAVTASALAASLERVQKNTKEPYPNAKAGAAVVMNPQTGEVLAMVSLPAFDPNSLAVGISKADWALLNDPKLRPLINRASGATYPPGSTFKMVTATAALEEAVTSLAEKVFDTGVFRIANAKCWVRTGHGAVDLVKALAVSCNNYFYEMGTRLGIDKIAEYASQYGLGMPTGIDLDNDKGGLLPTAQWKIDRFKEPWWPGETIYAAIGQGYHVYTPLQLANYISTLANGGTRYQPYLVQAIAAPDGTILQSFGPKVVGTVDASAATIAAVQKGMHAVTQPGGTAYWAFNGFPLPVAAKTGTAQNSSGDDHGVFVAYAPVDNPQIVIAVLVEQGGHGSTTGGPVARAVFEEYFKINTIGSSLVLPVGIEE